MMKITLGRRGGAAWHGCVAGGDRQASQIATIVATASARRRVVGMVFVVAPVSLLAGAVAVSADGACGSTSDRSRQVPACATAAASCATDTFSARAKPATNRAGSGSKATIEKSPSWNQSAACGNLPR